jgi:hypothetical protein
MIAAIRTMYFIRRRRQVARQGSAKPSAWVQIPSSPLKASDLPRNSGKSLVCINDHTVSMVRVFYPYGKFDSYYCFYQSVISG